MRNVSDIIEAAGGIKAVAKRLPAKVRSDGSSPDREWAVRKWPNTGIPERHWPLLLRMAPDLTVDALFAANRRARGEPMPRRKAVAAEVAA